MKRFYFRFKLGRYLIQLAKNKCFSIEKEDISGGWYDVLFIKQF